jgi:hypothetical protein
MKNIIKYYVLTKNELHITGLPEQPVFWTDVMMFLPKKSAKNWRFLYKTKLYYVKFDHNIVFFRTSPMFRQKLLRSLKIAIITSTPGLHPTKLANR